MSFDKPFDRLLKELMDESPRLFLDMIGLLPRDAAIQLEPLRPETAPSVVLPDYVAALTVGKRTVTLHVEFYVAYSKEVPGLMARYGGSLAWQYQRPVVSVMMLLRRDRAPAEVPSEGEYSIGETCTTHAYKVVKAWELDPAPILDSGDPKLFPWALLLNSSDDQVREIAAALRTQGDDEAVTRFLTLGSLRYHRDVLERMLGGRMGFVQAFMEGSSLVQEAKELAAEQGHARGHAKGLAEGLAEGRAEEARRLLRICLQSRFPGLEALPEIDGIPSIESMEAILKFVLTATSRNEVEQSILNSARPN